MTTKILKDWLGSLSLSCFLLILTPGHYPEESTILGENPLKELTPAAWNQTIFTKIKASPPLHLQPSPGSTCRISTSLLVLLKKSRERPPSWKVFMSYLPIFCIASSPLGHLPFHFSCSWGRDPWNWRSGPFPLFADPRAQSKHLSLSYCRGHLLFPGDDAKNATRARNCPHLLQASFQSVLCLWCIHFGQFHQSKLPAPLHTRHRTRYIWTNKQIMKLQRYLNS